MADKASNSHVAKAASAEGYNDEFETAVPETRKAANITAKRSELDVKKYFPLRRITLSAVREDILKRRKEAETWNVRTVLSMLGLGERPLCEGKTRVRWRCGCGRNMYDDFTELRSGAAADLESWLSDSMRNHAVFGSSNPPQNASLRSAASPSASNSGNQQTAESDISLQSLASTANTLPGSYGTAAIALDVHLEKCWLLVCGNLQRGPDSLLTQLDLSSTPSDKKLFDDLKESYSRRKSTWNLQPFLRDVKTIRFVQVNLFI